MKLVYWVSQCQGDSPAYSIRKRTRKAVVAQLKQEGVNYGEKGDSYGKPHKVTIQYDSAFDLLVQCLGEGGIYERGETDEPSTYHQDEDEN